MVLRLKKKDFFASDAFPITVNRPVRKNVEQHSHQFSELVLITSGYGLHITDRETWPISAGDVFVISGNRPHEYREQKDLALVNIMYDADRLVMPTLDLNALDGFHALFILEPARRKRQRFEARLRLSMNELSCVEGLVNTLEEELKARRPGFRFMAVALFMQIVGYLSRCYSRSRTPDSRALLRIGQAISYLESHFDRDISLKEIAGIAHMSTRNFQRTFREAMGSSPIDYLIRQRVAHAADFLRQQNQAMTITELAFKAGFQDSNYFSRQFKKVMGTSPREFRKRTAR